jgi:hypothetical protein
MPAGSRGQLCVCVIIVHRLTVRSSRAIGYRFLADRAE